MKSFVEARATILSHVQTLGIERMPLLDALGRVLAHDLVAPWDMPLWDNSAMDGYAARSEDCETIPCQLRVAGFMPAGVKPGETRVEPGCAIRIMTGAPLPEGCDAVIPVEHTNSGRKLVTVSQPVRKGQHLRLRGADVRAGSTFLTKGTLIHSLEINLLASFGMALVPVFRQPRVAIFTSGDELVELGRSPGPGEIINSNTLALAAAVRESGGLPRIVGIARDTLEGHLELLREGLKADALITSAGVSAGDRDFVRLALDELGARQLFWKVAMRPGAPTAFALHGSTPVFCLPGNPAATLITFEEFVRPALLRMQGRKSVLRPLFRAELRSELRKKARITQFIRVRLEREDGRWIATPCGREEADTPALAVLPAGNTSLSAGDEVDVHFRGSHIDLV